MSREIDKLTIGKFSFMSWDTGGGCMALGWVSLNFATEILITVVDDPGLPIEGEDVMVGVYTYPNHGQNDGENSVIYRGPLAGVTEEMLVKAMEAKKVAP